MKPLFLILVAAVLVSTALRAAQHTINSAGFTFSPTVLNVSPGDTIVFSISGSHNAVQVAQSTWNVNGSLPLSGGFTVPFGGGSIVLTDTGTHFYICTPHISLGMKGRIIVNPPPPPTTTITLNSLADQDGLHGTTTDRVAKNWGLKLYQDSIGSGIVLDSIASGTTLAVAGLGAGTYVAFENDSASWSHISLIVDGVPQGATSQGSWTFTVPAGETHSVSFVNTVPNMIINSGLAFTPDTLTVDVGDTVWFVLTPGHLVREVSQATWLANGTASNGGFNLPTGGGSSVAEAGGIVYYVCVAHAGSGSKGLVMVNPIPPSTITLNSFADQDGSHATAADRIGKTWSMRLYQDSVGSGIVVDSVNSASSLVVGGLAPGVYVAVEADSAPWTHISQTVDGAPQGATAATSRSFSVGSGESRTVDFINHVPNMIISSGFAFSPETLSVDSGETVWFVLDSQHTAREVDSAAWVANDTLSNGGFDLPEGGGAAQMNVAGVAYYVCVPHASGGMKGIISVVVQPSQGALSDTVADGWNLLSYPYLMEDTVVSALYPAASTPAYIYESGYTTRTSIGNGPGYWIKLNGAQVLELSGLLVESDTIPVAQGWNIVGTISEPVGTASIVSVPPGLVTSSFYGYDAGYLSADTLRPGRGYWVKVSAAGSLIISSAPGAAPAAGRFRDLPDGVSRGTGHKPNH